MIEEKLLKVLKDLLIVVLIGCIILYLFMKRFVFNSDSDNLLTKKLMNYISNDKDINNNKDKDYESLIVKNTKNIKLDDESSEKINKVVRFAEDYCRASPNISLKNKSILNIGWRMQKYNYDVEYEIVNYKGEKFLYHSIMTAIPLTRSVLNFEDDFIRENFIKLIQSFSHKYILSYLHLDILPSQRLMIKIQQFKEDGSLKDLIYKSNPFENYIKKYPIKGKALHNSLISQYGRQILEALNYLHSHKWYHMNLHTGNIILDHDSIKISELENFVNDLPIKNENYYNYVFTNFNNETFLKNDISVLSEIFSYNYNIFEKFDIISFGRVIYEMTFGKELKAPYPDDMEYNDIDNSIADILRLIFVKKYSKFNSNSTITLPDVSAGDLLKHKFFNNGFNEIFDTDSNYDSVSKNFDNYCSFIKENIFNQTKYLKSKLNNKIKI